MLNDDSRESPVIVIGGTGFVGRHVVAEFIRAGHDVIVISRHSAAGQHRIRHIALDLCSADPHRIADLLLAERVQFVVNTSGAVWRVSEEQMWAVNANLVERVVAAVARVPWRPSLVHLGSVYEYAPVPAGARIGDDTPQLPVSEYGRSKLHGTRIVQQATAAGKIDGRVLRLCNITGPGSPSASLLGSVAARLAAMRGDGLNDMNQAKVKLGPLTGYRDFLDARDAANAVRLAAARPVTGAVLNLGRGEAVSLRHVVELMISISGLSVGVDETVVSQASGARDAGTDWIAVDIAPAMRHLGWRPRVSLPESLRALWEELLADRDQSGAPRPPDAVAPVV